MRKFVAAIVAAVLVSAVCFGAAFAVTGATNTVKSGLVKEKGSWYYYENGDAVTKEWKTVKGKTYYFGKSGKAMTGKGKVSHYYCYFGDDAVLDRKIDLDKKLIALTYDDGPSKNTKTILKTLKKYDSVATFFVVGSRVSSYKSTVKKAVKQGCEIGNHTWSHNTLTKISKDQRTSVVAKANKAVKKAAGVTPSLLRPPGGATSSSVLKSIDMPEILWSIDTLDWKTRNATKTINAVVKKAKDGDIVLMHDLYEPTATATKTIVPKLVKKGFQLVTVSELADCKGVKLKGGKKYSRIK